LRGLTAAGSLGKLVAYVLVYIHIAGTAVRFGTKDLGPRCVPMSRMCEERSARPAAGGGAMVLEERVLKQWPVTIFRDPCSADEQPRWVAVACEPSELPPEAANSCLVLQYWRRQLRCPPLADGETPDAALANLLATLSGAGEG